MRNLLVTIAFDGSPFHGWQIQANALSVQEAFQDALYPVLGGMPDIKACSRTDTGVHARQFCISVKTESPIACDRLVGALNHCLPKSIAALSCRQMEEDFHARYSCKGKEYSYEIWNHPVRDPFLQNRALHYWYPIDETLLNTAAQGFVGTHDFSAFCTPDARKKGDLTRRIYRARVEREGDMVRFVVAADGFLYHMVRIMTGTLLRVREGKIAPGDIGKIIASGQRNQSGPTAPAEGLYLNRVFYEGEGFLDEA
ncbi:MAG: tRNA pseudouridine(38-40) synthase TruA [Oscillospiraceae bacterium]